jgi:hypothetical protein
MNKVIAIHFRPTLRVVGIPLVCGIVLACFCSAQLSFGYSPAGQTSALKLKLNANDVGTTENTSVLEKSLLDIYDRRPKRSPVEDDNIRAIYYAVLVSAENDAQLSEVQRVFEAVANAHWSPWLAVEGDSDKGGNVSATLNGKKAPNGIPNPQLLIVSIGNPSYPGRGLISGGIRIYLSDLPLKLSDGHSILKQFMVVDVFKDDQYAIGEKSIPASALTDQLKTGLRGRTDKRVVFVTRSDSEIHWSSFLAVAKAAREAGAEMIQLQNLVP